MGEITSNMPLCSPQDRQLISLFYAHKLPVNAIYEDGTANPMVELCKEILTKLLLLDIAEIIEIIKESHNPFPIGIPDIPQYSSLDDCIYRVPYLIKCSQLTNINYEQMGFLLRTEPRSSVADSKYGENHAKTAAQMGLCAFTKCRFNMSYLGEAFLSFSFDEQKILAKKLILYIPIIQNYYAAGESKELIENYFSLMAKSTRHRRQSNVWTLIYSITPKPLYDI